LKSKAVALAVAGQQIQAVMRLVLGAVAVVVDMPVNCY
jgi:hypothetical protein